jgi:hypothetical protein
MKGGVKKLSLAKTGSILENQEAGPKYCLTAGRVSLLKYSRPSVFELKTTA